MESDIAPKMEIIVFENEDLIVTSCFTETGPACGPDDGSQSGGNRT